MNARLVVLALAACLILPEAQALIERIFSLEEIMDSSKVIVEAKLEKVDLKKQLAIARVTNTIKGKCPFKRIKINLSVGQTWHPAALLPRLKVDAPILFFYDINDKGRIDSLAHVNGLWFQLKANIKDEKGKKKDPDKVWWLFTHIELRLTRTYLGPTPDLIKLVRDVVQDRRKPPAPNPATPTWTRASLMQGLKYTPAESAGGERPRIFTRVISLAHGGREPRSVSWADYDGDGDLDVLICSREKNLLYRNDMGTFTDVTKSVGLTGGSRAASWADYDGDGDLDLFDSTPRLWTNVGGKFSNDTKLLPRLGRTNTEGAGWIDANGDGRPDVLLTNGEYGIRLFLNSGRGPQPFVDASAAWGLGRKGLGRGNGDFLSIVDFDGDGYAEFLYNVGKGVLTRNEDGERFRPAAYANVKYRVSNRHKIGVAFGDYDKDGDLDLFIPQEKTSYLYRNNNNFTFTDVIKATKGLASLPPNARSATWGDVNLDGLLDLVVGFSDRSARLYINQGNGTFADWTDSCGLQDFSCAREAAGMAFADFDQDGDLDLLIVGEHTNAGILINEWPRAKRRGVALRVKIPAREPPGTIVRLYDPTDGGRAMRQVGLACNFSSQGPPEAFFAVAPGTYKVSVLYTNGKVRQESLKVGAEGLSVLLAAPDGH